MSMKLHLLGVRGSRPTHKQGMLGYGGNSTSMEFIIEDSDFHIFLDGGSGIAPKGHALGETPKNDKFYFLITHTHWDHIIGLPFFEPLYSNKNKITFFTSETSKASINNLFFNRRQAKNLPVPYKHIQADVKFNIIGIADHFKVEDKIDVHTYQLNHQDITLGYRLNYKDDSVAIITDNAPIDNGNFMGTYMTARAKDDPDSFEKEFTDGLIEFIRDCHTVVYDTHFDEHNLKPDWGHSSPKIALDICHKANVKRLILFHHAPEDLDNDVLQKTQSILDQALEYGIEVVAAKEGDTWTLHSV